MSGREFEANLLQRCILVARATDGPMAADNQCDANVFRVAAMIIGHQWPQESARLMQASELYFANHPGQQLHASEVVRRGWIIGFPRLRDMLGRQLRQG
jgi:hypothetical protein